jgi:hypothetical protein
MRLRQIYLCKAKKKKHKKPNKAKVHPPDRIKEKKKKKHSKGTVYWSRPPVFIGINRVEMLILLPPRQVEGIFGLG